MSKYYSEIRFLEKPLLLSWHILPQLTVKVNKTNSLQWQRVVYRVMYEPRMHLKDVSAI